MKNCEMNVEDEKRKFDPSELICPACCPLSFEKECKLHKAEFIEYKCKYCCSVALWFCWGNTHFCEPCHQKAWELKKLSEKDLKQCKSPEDCPLKLKHPPNGNEMALGCSLCRANKN